MIVFQCESNEKSNMMVFQCESNLIIILNIESVQSPEVICDKDGITCSKQSVVSLMSYTPRSREQDS